MLMSSVHAEHSLADYLAKKLTEAREGQLRTTDHFAGLTSVARAAKATRWARMNIHTEAPTPSNFEQAEGTFLESVYVLNAAQSVCLAILSYCGSSLFIHS